MNTSNQNANLTQLKTTIANNLAVLLFFNTQSCNVGEALEPKVKNLLSSNFPKIKMFTVDLNFSPQIAASYNAFVEPTILVFFDGKETIRKSRNIGIYELEEAIKRPYQLIFE
ncbi:thioredoxin [Lutibacter sp. HS1-25]|uniref:thioredoxin family protein n=1 Tax=Lutibacter sp. HS1-25 TaxID=2485000 RepID=UPI001012540F|nr:thioredoxin family protein [Lutibacter sp. HS1-25]RXP46548.1 thioredoxin [Lutibacter sp. HS1-25]